MTDETVIGPVELLESVPVVVTVDGDRFVLSTRENGDPVLYGAVCPHQRGRVRVIDETTLRCPNHRWEFDASTGERLGGEEQSLETYDVTIVGDGLRAVFE